MRECSPTAIFSSYFFALSFVPTTNRYTRSCNKYIVHHEMNRTTDLDSKSAAVPEGEDHVGSLSLDLFLHDTEKLTAGDTAR